MEAREARRPIVCIFGKILYDISEPEQGGPAHANIREWLNDTIRACKDSPALFLVKPHPSEIKKSFGTPTERFVDLIEAEIPNNVIVCEHRWFNIGDLLPIIDLGVVWAGTTALELGAAGIPCIVCNYWGRRDHPIAFHVPLDRAAYHRMLADPGRLEWPDAERRRCVQLIDCLSSVDFHIPYPYAQIPMRGIDKAPKKWLDAKLDHYLEFGDPYVEKIARRIVGTDFFEGTALENLVGVTGEG